MHATYSVEITCGSYHMCAPKVEMEDYSHPSKMLVMALLHWNTSRVLPYLANKTEHKQSEGWGGQELE